MPTMTTDQIAAHAWAELTYLCVACGHQWDAAEVTIDLPRCG